MSRFHRDSIQADGPINVSRRQFLGASASALVLGVVVPGSSLHAQGAPAAASKSSVPVSTFLEVRADSTVLLRSPFVEGGQGIYTGLAQIVGEELDVNPARFTVECAPPGAEYWVFPDEIPIRFTGASRGTRTSYDTMRSLGATARQMLLQAAAARLGVSVASLSTESGQVRHAASGRRLEYGAIAAEAAALPVPENVPLRAEKDFRWIGKPFARLDVRQKSTGQAVYGIDLKVDGMLQAAIQHAPRLGGQPGDFANEAEVQALPGVHSIHRLPGAVAVLADRWWHARSAVEALKVTWKEPPPGTPNAMPVNFSTEAFRAFLAAAPGPGAVSENEGDVAAAMRAAVKVIEATYDAPNLVHGQLEPPSALARFNADGTLEVWTPNQAPELFQKIAADVAGIAPEKVVLHSPLLGGFFGRHFIYETAIPMPQAILLSKASGRPVKVIWSREEEFLRDAMRPMGLVRFRAGLGADGLPVAIEAEAVGEGPIGRWFGVKPDVADPSVVEGMQGKPYAIPNRRIAHIPLRQPTIIGFWRSVGHSMNAFFYESFLDEIANAAGQDPYELRLRLLADKPRHKTLLRAVADLSGGWKRGPFTAADGTRRARGVSLASPFGSEAATIAEVSVKDGAVVAHEVWLAIDPGRMVNPAIIEAQMNSCVALGLSSALLEQVVYVNGEPQARNFDKYSILPPDRMPKVHVRIVESGAPIGGVGEVGVPGVSPAVANAVAALTGQRVRSLPLSKTKFGNLG